MTKPLLEQIKKIEDDCKTIEDIKDDIIELMNAMEV